MIYLQYFLFICNYFFYNIMCEDTIMMGGKGKIKS